ncbi:Hint domain-containing protein [Granulibacter bethesdensis]|uniref:Hint domain-containing protein n=1 Tax=Granulibacter bethesdensis TaxID=364410 RepID=UPI0003F208FF|nr:Hint domain-containing protein [Granulibacter bethesdensis]AHJ66000.1 Adhesin family protein [Granulibacter bethesdensis CGDNIH4]
MTDYTTNSGVVYSVTPVRGLFGILTGYNVVITDPDGTTTHLGTVAPDHVLTGNGFSFSLASVLFGSSYVVVPGASGTITIAASLATLNNNTFYVGGTANINVLASGLSGLTLNVDGGAASLTNGNVAGLLSGSTINITNGGVFSNGTALASVLNNSTVNFGNGGGTLIVNAGGAVINLSSTSINNYTPSKDTIEFQNTVAHVKSYTISASGSARTITLYGDNGQQIGHYTANLAAGVTLNAGTYYTDSGNNPLVIAYAGGNTFIGACFLAGSMIGTPDGERPVEELRAGDRVLAFRDGVQHAAQVTWAGHASVTACVGLPDDMAGYPVRVLKDALADGVPSRDLLITPEHCLFLDGKFIPVRMLVNGSSIIYDRSITDYQYYHIETEGHAVIRAEGALTESYLDTGNRIRFGTADGNVVSIGHGNARSWQHDAAAPLAVSREVVEPIFRALAARAEVIMPGSRNVAPELTTDADLHLVSDAGQILRKVRETNGRAVFMIPAGVETVRILSRTSRPCDVFGPFVDDRRTLGVLVGEVVLFDAGSAQAINLTLANEGWNAWDEAEAGRWTAGNAVLKLDRRSQEGMGMLAIQILSAGPYVSSAAEVEPEAQSA